MPGPKGPKEQPLPPDVMGRDDATEVLRAFVVDGGLSIAFTRAFEEPDMWGLLLVDIARHAARAYAQESSYSEAEALARVVDMFESEIARPTDIGSTTPKSQQGHLPCPLSPIISTSWPKPFARRRRASPRADCRSARC